VHHVHRASGPDAPHLAFFDFGAEVGRGDGALGVATRRACISPDLRITRGCITPCIGLLRATVILG